MHPSLGEKLLKVRIYQPSKTAMQAGKTQTHFWIIEPEVGGDQYLESVMHWTGSTSTGRQVKLRFDSLEQATDFARSQQWQYQIVQPHTRRFCPKNYAANFSSNSSKPTHC